SPPNRIPKKNGTITMGATCRTPGSYITPLHELPRGNRKNFPKFKGDGKIHPDENIAALDIVACGVLGVEHEDVS
ncbi:hypothetical protein KI387_038308, partial [Taxus chinensis]